MSAHCGCAHVTDERYETVFCNITNKQRLRHMMLMQDLHKIDPSILFLLNIVFSSQIPEMGQH